MGDVGQNVSTAHPCCAMFGRLRICSLSLVVGLAGAAAAAARLVVSVHHGERMQMAATWRIDQWQNAAAPVQFKANAASFKCMFKLHCNSRAGNCSATFQQLLMLTVAISTRRYPLALCQAVQILVIQLISVKQLV